jgi:hypothetical protein
MAEHVEDISTGPSEGKSRGLHTKSQDSISQALLYYGLHALFRRAVIAQTPQDRPYFQGRALLILQDLLRIMRQLLPLQKLHTEISLGDLLDQMQGQFLVGVVGAEFDLDVDPADIVRIRVGLTIGYLLETLALGSEKEVDGYAAIGGTVILLPVELDQRITI